MLKALLAAALIAALTAPAVAATESDYVAASAFNDTDAAQTITCQTMIRYSRFVREPMNTKDPIAYSMLALSAKQCLSAVRQETSEAIPAKVPQIEYAIGCMHYIELMKGKKPDQNMTWCPKS